MGKAETHHVEIVWSLLISSETRVRKGKACTISGGSNPHQRFCTREAARRTSKGKQQFDCCTRRSQREMQSHDQLATIDHGPRGRSQEKRLASCHPSLSPLTPPWGRQRLLGQQKVHHRPRRLMASIIISSSVRGRAREPEANAAERGCIDNAFTLLKQPGPAKNYPTAVLHTKIKEDYRK